MKTGISEKWSKEAVFWVGNKDGVHCHWCKFIKSSDGSSYCKNKSSKFVNMRIRTWDGEDCAKECKFFGLSDWYKDDKNYKEYFAGETK